MIEMDNIDDCVQVLGVCAPEGAEIEEIVPIEIINEDSVFIDIDSLMVDEGDVMGIEADATDTTME